MDRTNQTITKTAILKQPEYIEVIRKHLQSLSSPIDKDDSFNKIIYGLPCQMVQINQLKDCRIFQAMTEHHLLTVAIHQDEAIKNIDIVHITHISFTPEKEIIAFIKNPHAYIHILINKATYDFIFESQLALNQFLTGLIILYDDFIVFDDSLIENKIIRVWKQYDKDYSKKLDKAEFGLFYTDLQMKVGNKLSQDDLFRKIDLNKSGSIEFDEFVRFYLQYTSGEEFSDLFMRYSSDSYIVTPFDLQNFYIRTQKEEIGLEEACEIIIFFKQNLAMIQKKELIDKVKHRFNEVTEREMNNISMKLNEFKLFLHSNLTSVYNREVMNMQQDMSRPLNDYFINSTHNTYITGHQLSGSSSPKMYSFALLEGYRLVELDCYDGEDDIIITHGYTMVSNILLSQILAEMRKYAFVNSPYPVLLSIENHMNAQSQVLFVKKCKSILKDLYIIDHNNLPQQFPSPNELKGKFILKISGKRIFNKTNMSLKVKAKCPQEKTEGKSLKCTLLSEDICFETKVDKDDDALNSKYNTIELSKKGKKEITEIDKEKLKKIQKNQETTSELDFSRGMFGTKLNLKEIDKMNYQPWEMVTLKCSKLIAYSESNQTRNQMIDYNKNSFTKAYPTNFDSTNYDPVKCWITGAQVAAMNFQTVSDDDLLLNRMFFKINQNCGLVLKPHKLFPESDYYESYDYPYGTVEFKLLSVIGVNVLFSKSEIQFEDDYSLELHCSIQGSDSDDKLNKKYEIKLKGNYLKLSFDTIDPAFAVYEKDLSAFWFRLNYGEEVIGRAVVPIQLLSEGIRTIRFYDIKGEECNDSFIVVHIKKTISETKQKY